MSDCVLNLRIVWFHIQWTTYGRWRFSFNYFRYEKYGWRDLFPPLQIVEWDWSKRYSEKLESK